MLRIDTEKKGENMADNVGDCLPSKEEIDGLVNNLEIGMVCNSCGRSFVNGGGTCVGCGSTDVEPASESKPKNI
jgi:uncharacterized OB-fold protein